jgi:hypothetical protein
VKNALNESTESRKLLILATQLFQIFEAAFGLKETKVLWRIIPQKARQRGKPGPKGPRYPQRDRELTALFNAAVVPLGDRAISELAEALHRTRPGEFGNSQMAIQQHLRRLRRKNKAWIATMRIQNPLP